MSLKDIAIDTVNVIEYYDETIAGVVSFPDTTEGKEAAEELFELFATENGVSEEDIEIGLEDGYCEISSYQVFIIHSS